MTSRDATGGERKPYWYECYHEECVLCGRSDNWKARRYTPKPEEYEKRHHFSQNACHDHFL